MNTRSDIQVWDLWYPQAAATGVAFARGRLNATTTLWVHAAPPMLTVEVRSDDGKRLAFAKDLAQTADRPMTRLVWLGEKITREDLYPTEQHIGELVILPGGEVGKLINWWNAEDGIEWRWQIEFYNHR
ncbi:MAG: hypothetical protein QM730_15655 [Anaerolineales bacterium]